ncbi:MAG: L-histidine N(alpha)-methyltransferase [Bacteroidota bacterium]
MTDAEFLKDVELGLSSNPRSLPSKYLYDDTGSALFQEIMKMPEYYPTDCEMEILSAKQMDFNKYFQNGKPLEFVELGAGDGFKVVSFLKFFNKNGTDFSYKPIDISSKALETLEHRVASELPGIKIETYQDDYFLALEKLSRQNHSHRIYLFLGGNIGNFSKNQALEFLINMRASILKDDLVIVGFDLKKDPRVIINAYDDPHGITAKFNLNMLRRINRELDANFDLDAFQFYPYYYPETGEVKSYLYSLKDQEVYIDKARLHVPFKKWDYIHTEISKKFDLKEIEELAKQTGFRLVQHVFDEKQYFSDSIFRAV